MTTITYEMHTRTDHEAGVGEDDDVSGDEVGGDEVGEDEKNEDDIGDD